MYWRNPLNRPARVMVVGGLAVGLGLGAMAAVNAASSPSSSTPSAVPAAPGAPGQAAAGAGRPHRPGGHGFGGGGTITALSGNTVTLRTEAGTQTVNVNEATAYMKERQSIKLADLHNDDVIHVTPAAGSTPPATPGTGTLTAARIVVVMPTLGGRVTDVNGDTVSLVGADGRLLTVTLTGTTRYYTGKNPADRAAIIKDSRIRAEGGRDTLTHLTADTVTVLPARPAGAPAPAPAVRGAFVPAGLDAPPPGDPLDIGF